MTVTSLNNFAGTVPLPALRIRPTPAGNSSCTFGSSSLGNCRRRPGKYDYDDCDDGAKLSAAGARREKAFRRGRLLRRVAPESLAWRCSEPDYARAQKKLLLALGCLMLLGLIILPSCSSSSGGGGGGGGGGTPAGTYNVIVTGTSGSTSHTSGVILVVN